MHVVVRVLPSFAIILLRKRSWLFNLIVLLLSCDNRCSVSSSGREDIQLFSCSTQLSINFQLLINTKMLKYTDLLAFKLSDVVFILLINVKMPTSVGILTFMSRINFVLS